MTWQSESDSRRAGQAEQREHGRAQKTPAAVFGGAARKLRQGRFRERVVVRIPASTCTRAQPGERSSDAERLQPERGKAAVFFFKRRGDASRGGASGTRGGSRPPLLLKPPPGILIFGEQLRKGVTGRTTVPSRAGTPPPAPNGFNGSSAPKQDGRRPRASSPLSKMAARWSHRPPSVARTQNGAWGGQRPDGARGKASHVVRGWPIAGEEEGAVAGRWGHRRAAPGAWGAGKGLRGVGGRRAALRRALLFLLAGGIARFKTALRLAFSSNIRCLKR